MAPPRTATAPTADPASPDPAGDADALADADTVREWIREEVAAAVAGLKPGAAKDGDAPAPEREKALTPRQIEDLVADRVRSEQQKLYGAPGGPPAPAPAGSAAPGDAGERQPQTPNWLRRFIWGEE
jgi:hypothetical protein